MARASVRAAAAAHRCQRHAHPADLGGQDRRGNAATHAALGGHQLDASAPAKTAALEAWYRTRTDIEDRTRGANTASLPRMTRFLPVWDLIVGRALVIGAPRGNLPEENLMSLNRTCGCRESHPRSSGGVFVLVDDASKAVTSPDVKSGELAGIRDQIGKRV